MTRRTTVLGLLVVALGLVGVAAGMAVDQVRGPLWSGQAGVVVRLVSPDEILLTGLAPEVKPEDLTDAAALARSQEVLTRAAAALAGPGRPPTPWTDLAQRVTVAPIGVSHIIKVTAKAPDRNSAGRTADAVAAAYVATITERLHTTAATLETVPRPPDPARQGGTDVTADVRARAVVLGRDITIAETFHSDEPTQEVPGIRTPAALGVVGLAAGALGAVALTMLRPAPSARHGAHAGGTRFRPTTEELEKLLNGHGGGNGNGRGAGLGTVPAVGNGNGNGAGHATAGANGNGAHAGSVRT